MFHVRKETVDKYPDTLLAAALSSDMQAAERIETPEGDAYFFDRDPELFRRVILSFYTFGYWPWLPSDAPGIVYDELCYWGLAPVAAPKPGQDLGDFPTFLGFAFSELDNGESMQVPVVASDPSTGTYNTPFKDAGTTIVAREDLVRSTALRRGVYLRVEQLEGRVQRGKYGYFLNDDSTYLVYPAGVAFDSDDTLMQLGPVKLQDAMCADSSRLPYGVSVQFDVQGEKYQVGVDYGTDKSWTIYLKCPEKWSWPYDITVDIRASKEEPPNAGNCLEFGEEVCQLFSNRASDQYCKLYAEEIRKLEGTQVYVWLWVGGKTKYIPREQALAYMGVQNSFERAVRITAYKL